VICENPGCWLETGVVKLPVATKFTPLIFATESIAGKITAL